MFDKINKQRQDKPSKDNNKRTLCDFFEEHIPWTVFFIGYLIGVFHSFMWMFAWYLGGR